MFIWTSVRYDHNRKNNHRNNLYKIGEHKHFSIYQNNNIGCSKTRSKLRQQNKFVG